jgi:hypothetical protein
MERPSWAPPDVDIDQPSISRIWDWFLDGSHNFAVDREVAKQMLKLMPEGPRMAQASRAFLRRAVRMCAAAGVTQFLDIGSGIPTVGNVHEVARAADPQSRVVYVDTDPVAVSHTRQLLGSDPTTTVLRGDLREPDAILDSPELRGTLDLDRPVAVMLIMILHFIHDEEDPAGILRRFLDRLPAGSMLAIAHGSPNTERMPDEHLHAAREMYTKSVAQVRLRTQPEVRALFDGWELVHPGVVWIPDWRPDLADNGPESLMPNAGYAGVGIKV